MQLWIVAFEQPVMPAPCAVQHVPGFEHLPPLHVSPAQHSELSEQTEFTGLHAPPQTPALHVLPLQQSALTAQLPPAGLQLEHFKLSHVSPAQQSPFTEQDCPTGLQAVQAKPVHCRPLQHSEVIVQNWPAGMHAEHTPPLHDMPIQHSADVEHEPPWFVHGPMHFPESKSQSRPSQQNPSSPQLWPRLGQQKLPVHD